MLETFGSAGASNGSTNRQGSGPGKEVSREWEADGRVYVLPRDVRRGVCQACLTTRSLAAASSGRPLRRERERKHSESDVASVPPRSSMVSCKTNLSRGETYIYHGYKLTARRRTCAQRLEHERLTIRKPACYHRLLAVAIIIDCRSKSKYLV